MAKVPFRKIEHEDEATSKLQDNVEEAINRITAQTLDDQADGKTYRKLIGVNYAHQLTASGIAASTITSGLIATGTVTVGNLAPCNQFSVYRDTAFSLGANARSALIANRVVKDVGGGYNTGNGIYTLPAAGDWLFTWSVGINTMATDGRQMFSALVVNSGEIPGDVKWTSGASQYLSSVGTYLYCNGLAGDAVTVRVFNGDTTPRPMSVLSGGNYFQGYQVR